MANRLRNLLVRNVAAVERPANQRKWLVVKSDIKSENERRRLVESAVRDKWGSTQDYSKAYLEDIYDDDAIVYMNGTCYAVGFEVDKDLKVTFDEPRPVTRAYVEKKRLEKQAMSINVVDVLGEHLSTLTDTIANAADGEERKQAVMDYVASVQKSIPELVSAVEDVTKSGRKISSARMAKLQTLYKTLGEIIAEQEGEEEEMEKQQTPDAGALTKIGHSLAAMFGRAIGADDETIAKLEKAAQGEEVELPEVVKTALAAQTAELAKSNDELKKANDELKARLDKAEAENKATAEAAAKLREEAELRKFAEEVSGYKDVGLDPAKDAVLLKSIEEKAGKEAADRLRELFKAQLAQKNAGSLMREIGSTGAGGGSPTTAAAEVEQKLKEVVSKNDKLDRGAAMDQVFAENPGLYERYRQEVSVRV